MNLFDMYICHVCGKEKPDHLISVRTTDLSDRFDLQRGSVLQNVRYCNTIDNCIQKSLTLRFIKNYNNGEIK